MHLFSAASAIVNADGVNLHILFLHKATHFTLSETGVIISTVGDEKEYPPRVMGAVHVAHRENHRIIERRASPRLSQTERIKNRGRVGGKGQPQFRFISKRDKSSSSGSRLSRNAFTES